MVIFERLAQLLMPAETTLEARAVEAPPSWELRDTSLGALDAAVWGRAPLPSGTPRPVAVRAAVRRERSLMRLRRELDSGLRSIAVYRWSPPDLGAVRPRAAIKNAMLSGAIVELSRGTEFVRTLDAAASAAGFPARVREFRPGSGGSVRITSNECPGELLRVGAAATPVDPGRAAGALATLEDERIPLLPRLVRRGSAAGGSWSVETTVRGDTPGRLTPNLLAQLVEFCLRLPAAPGPPVAFDEDLEEVSEHLPSRAAPIRDVAEPALAECSTLPGIARHGDLWTGNLLVGDGGELSGVIDWDAWHPAGVPGADLLHLYGFDRARRVKNSLGECWLQRPWLDAAFASATQPYWKALGILPSQQTLEAIAVAWWVNQVAQSLRRLPHLAARPAWVGSNVDAVVRGR